MPTPRAIVALSVGLKEALLYLASGTRDRQEERAAVTGEVQEAEAFGDAIFI